MNYGCQGELRINSEMDIVSARKVVREIAASIGFGSTDVTRIVTAASELTRNVTLYAGSGVMRWNVLDNESRTAGIELVFEDWGPGIADVKAVMERGYSTGSGLGMGLPGAERLMGELDIQSEIGKGTTVTIRKSRR